MRVIASTAALLMCSACGFYNSPLTSEQRDKVVSTFEKFCMEPYPSSVLEHARSCGNTFLLYQRDNGQKFVGQVTSLNRKTGGLSVTWQTSSGYIDPEVFYPGSTQELPGTIIRIADNGSNSKLWGQLHEKFQTQTGPLTMRR